MQFRIPIDRIFNAIFRNATRWLIIVVVSYLIVRVRFSSMGLSWFLSRDGKSVHERQRCRFYYMRGSSGIGGFVRVVAEWLLRVYMIDDFLVMLDRFNFVSECWDDIILDVELRSEKICIVKKHLSFTVKNKIVFRRFPYLI